MEKDLINVNFTYNGNLGILQQKTIDNKLFCGALLTEDVITREEYLETTQKIKNYFSEEVKNVLNNPEFYIDVIN